MLTNAIALVLAGLPGLLGMSLGAAIGLAPSSQARKGIACVLAGVGGIMGYFLVAGCIWALDQVGFRVFTTLNLTVLGLAALSAFALMGYRCYESFKNHSRTQHIVLRLGLGEAILLALLIVLLLTAAYQHLYLPVFAWDSLDWWVTQGGMFVEHDSNPDSFSKPFPYDHYHPITIVLIAAYSGFTGFFSGEGTASLLPWMIGWVSIMLIVAGFARSMSASMFTTLLLTYLCGGIPLLENHMLAAGYSELWLTAVIVSSAALIALGLQHSSITYVAAGSTVSLLAIVVKNTGAAYTAAVLFSLLLIVISKTANKWVWILLALGILSAGLLVGDGFSTSFGGNAFSLTINDSVIFEFAGRVWIFESFPLRSVLWNELYAFVFNSSFSLWLLATLLCSGWLFREWLASDNRNQQSLAGATFLFLSVLTILCLLTISQIFFAYAFDHAKPGLDTGNSRFTLPAVGVGMLFFAAMVPSILTDAFGRESRSIR